MPVWPKEATPRTIVVSGSGSWTVPDGVAVRVESVYADMDTSGGAAAPLLTIADPTGAVIARKRQTEAADDPASSSATWALRLADDGGGGGIQLVQSGGLVVTNGGGPTVQIEPKTELAVRVSRSNAQSIAAGPGGAILFDTLIYQVGAWGALGIPPSQLTIPEAGYYTVQGRVRWAVSADTAFRHCFVNVGGDERASLTWPNPPGVSVFQSPSATMFMPAGTHLSLTVSHGALAAVSLDAAYLAATLIQRT